MPVIASRSGASASAFGGLRTFITAAIGAMYWAGNQASIAGTIGKMSYSTEATSVIGATLATNMFAFGSVFNSPTAGYWNQINGGTTTGVVQKLTFSGETVSTLSTYMSQRQNYAGCNLSNSGTAGYFTGGYVTALGYQNTVDKVTFSTDVMSLNAGTMTYSPFTHATGANNGVAGYAIGGRDPVFTTIAKMPFSSETWANISATLSAGTWDLYTVSNSGTACYITGGLSGASVEISAIQKLLFSNDTISTISATIQTANQYGFGAANKNTAGYLYGGIGASSAQVLAINKLNFSNETRSVLSATIPQSSGAAWSQGATSTNCGTF